MPTDADAYQRLARALDAHRGDADAYRRLGEQMTARRHLLSPRYGNRRRFVRERLVPLGLKENAAYRLAYDLENGRLQGRDGFSAGNMLAFADAYETAPDAIITVLDGGNLEQGTPPEQDAQVIQLPIDPDDPARKKLAVERILGVTLDPDDFTVMKFIALHPVEQAAQAIAKVFQLRAQHADGNLGTGRRGP